MAKNQKIRASLWDRFHTKIERANNGCWLWTGARKEFGYGVIGIGRRSQGIIKAHRASWVLYNGEIPDDMCVLHKCDVPSCVNPEHLFLGTLSDNARDMVKKGRMFKPDNNGEKASWSKLCVADVVDIRTRSMTQREYAKKYGVSKSCIAEIWRGRNWKCVNA